MAFCHGLVERMDIDVGRNRVHSRPIDKLSKGEKLNICAPGINQGTAKQKYFKYKP